MTVAGISTMPSAQDHPILPSAWIYRLMDFHYHGFPWTPEDHYIELSLEKAAEIVRLRFDRPRQLSINEHFPTQLGLFISDVSSRGLEDISVEVGDFENQSIHFFAKSVARF